MGSNFEFIDVRKDFVLGLGDRLEVGKGFCLKVSGEKGLDEGGFKVGKGPKLLVVDGIKGEGCCPS